MGWGADGGPMMGMGARAEMKSYARAEMKSYARAEMKSYARAEMKSFAAAARSTEAEGAAGCCAGTRQTHADVRHSRQQATGGRWRPNNEQRPGPAWSI